MNSQGRAGSVAAMARAWAVSALAAGAIAGCGGESEPAAGTVQASAPAPQSTAAPEAGSPAPVAKSIASDEVATAPPAAAQPKSAPPVPAPAAQPTPPPKTAATPAPPPAQAKPLLITLPELVAQRDLWPEKVVLKKPFQLSRSSSIPAGREVAVYALVGNEIQLDTGTDLIQCPAADTDVLERASETLASLTPEQRALTEATLATRSDLWPLRLAITRPLQFQNGTGVPAGRDVILRAFENGSLSVYDRQLATFFPAEVHETDFLARARERMKLPEGERAPFFVRSVGEALEPASGAGFERSELVLVYKARLGCTRCSAFAPELKQFYARIKAEHPGFETVFMSDDSNGENARALVAKEELPGRVVAFERRLEAADLASQAGQLLPLVYLYDREGKLVARNHPNGGSPSAADILAEAEKRLKTAR